MNRIDKRWGGRCLLLGWLLAAAACSGDLDYPGADGSDEPLLLAGIRPTLIDPSATKADAETGPSYTKPEEIYVGREDFVDGDEAHFTRILRTEDVLEQFSYTNVWWKKNIAWELQPSAEGGKEPTIYWSDAHHPHTFIGYSLPQQSAGKTFDWVPKNLQAGDQTFNAYYGSIGEKTGSGMLEFTEQSLREEDLVVTHRKDLLPEQSVGIAEVPFRHALAQVQVRVDLIGFSAGSGALDNQTRVREMILKNMPMGYRWLQDESQAVQDVVTGETGDDADVRCDVKRDVKLWMPFDEGVNEGMNRQFFFYGLAVPGTRENLVFRFQVTYPDPKTYDPAKTDNPTLTKYYTSKIPSIEFYGGKCTTIRITLNHLNEDMTVSALYVDWGYADMPDQIYLTKKSTFLKSVDLTDITTCESVLPEISDYTWLHKTTDNNGSEIVVDAYGHTGTAEDPYYITSTDELLSLAKEVNVNGHEFPGKHIRLDASLTLQPKASLEKKDIPLNWIGIGNGEHVFKGVFHGEGRTISMLNGRPLFNRIASGTRVEQLKIEHVIEVNGNGALANSNAGEIVACRVHDPVTLKGTGAAGALVGTNSGTIVACSHDGSTTAQQATSVGGLVGTNSGTIAVSFQTGAVTGGGTTHPVANGGTLTDCYYNSTRYTAAVEGAVAKSTHEMQMPDFVDLLNENLRVDAPTEPYQYLFTPASYPTLERKSGGASE